MAYIGLKYFAFAPITAETEGSDPTYGTGSVCGKAIGADVTFNRNDNVLRADDGDAEFDNSITGGTITIEMDDLPIDMRVTLLGGYKDSTTNEYYDTAESGPYGGFGYIREVRYNGGSTRFDAYWVYKVAFAQEEDSATTMAESIEWQTPRLQGRMMGGYFGASAAAGGHVIYRGMKSFDTFAAAKAWINGKAGITTTTSTTTNTTPS